MSSPTSFNRLVVLDPSLISRVGHHYNYSRAVIQAAHRRGMTTMLLCNRNAVEDVVKEFPAGPLLQISAYTWLESVDPHLPNTSLDPFIEAGRQLLLLNNYTYNELMVLNQVIGPEDLLFFHTVTEAHILGITQWLMQLPEDRRPKTNIVLRFWPDRPHVNALLQLCGTMLSDPRMRTRFSSDTIELAALYSSMLHTPVDAIPIPHAPPEPQKTSRRFLPDLPADTVVIGYLGDCRGEKGFMHLRGIMENILSNPPRHCHFLIQAAGSTFPPGTLEDLEWMGGMANMGITVTRESLSTEDYYAFIEECDIMVISYYPKNYLYRSSGVFTEAAGAGKVTILPEGTSMHHEAQRFRTGFKTFDVFHSYSMAQAVRAAITDLPELAERAKTAAHNLRRYHNADNLMSYLLGEELAV